MHFIEQIFLFMNSVFNVSIILGNRPDPILIFQHSHNLELLWIYSIMNLHLISGFPKNPLFPWEWGSIPDPYRLQSWRVPNVEPALNVTSLQHKPLPFLSLSLVCVCVCVYEHSPMRCNESNILLQRKWALPGPVWIPSLAEKLWSSMLLHGIKPRWRARLGFITHEILLSTQDVWMDLQNMVLGQTQTVLQWCLKVMWDLLGHFWWHQMEP